MSYQIETILTDGRRVRAVFGSKDFSLIEKIKFDEYSEYEDFLYDRYKLPNEELSSLKLMENILNGDTEKEYSDKLKEVLPENNELQIDIEYIFSEARKEKLDILFCNY